MFFDQQMKKLSLQWRHSGEWDLAITVGPPIFMGIL